MHALQRAVRPFALVLAPAVLAACADPGSSEPERAAYLTLMGEDTLAVEWIEFEEGRVRAQSLIRGASTTYGAYHMEMDDDGVVTAYEARTWAGGSPEGDLLRHEYLAETDSGPYLVTVQDAESVRARAFDAPAGAVPFIDMLHWPFETAFRMQADQGELGRPVTTFSGATFQVEPNDDGTWALIHPSRGPSTVSIGEDGEILDLDGTGSTRAYLLDRVPHESLDPRQLGELFGERPLGELSGRGAIATQVAGIEFTGDYGTPRRRGREIFGALVAYGERWRTGANRATHLSFDGDIVIGGDTIPAGDYTLYSIPEEDGGTLIINRQTGQTGTRYDPAMDEARVPLTRERIDESVEVFEIAIVENEAGDGGRIELRWHHTLYHVPFTAG